MLEKMNMRLLGGVFVVVVLLCAGIYFYAEWSNKRFALELGEPPQFTASSKPAEETGINGVSSIKQTPSVEQSEFVNKHIDKDTAISEPASVEVSDPTNEDTRVETAETPESASGFDATPLLSAFGLPEEVTTLFDEGADAADFEEAQTHLIEEYGPSPEVEAIIDKLKQMSGRQVKLDDLTELFEAWIQVLPEAEQENRRQLMNVLTQLHEAKALGADGEVSIEVHVVGP